MATAFLAVESLGCGAFQGSEFMVGLIGAPRDPEAYHWGLLGPIRAWFKAEI